MKDALIETPHALEALVARALEAPCVAVDTEFFWERTYYPRLGLVQLGFTDDDTALIDAVALPDLSPLGRLLAAPDVPKILHDAQQDLLILRRASGAFPRNVFDTRLAAGFVGLPATLSLGAMLRAVLGVNLAKTETRTDWLRRPLSKRQRAYAHDDVRYLPAAYAALRERVGRRNRQAWLAEELAAYDDPDLYRERDPHEQFLRLSGTGKLSARQRAVLREVAAWREEEASRRDLPRGHVVADKVLVGVARRLPRSRAEVASVKGILDREKRRYGEALLRAVARGLDVPDDDCPPRPDRSPPDEARQARIYLAVAALTGRCLADDIDPALVATRADVTALVADGLDADAARHPLLRGWRRTFAGEDLLALLAGRRTLHLDPQTGLPLMRGSGKG